MRPTHLTWTYHVICVGLFCYLKGERCMENNFKKVMRGYDIDEVNNYIERMTLEFESKFSEKKSEIEMLKKKNEKLNDSLSELKDNSREDEKKKNVEFQSVLNNMESKLLEKEHIVEKIIEENKQIKESIDSKVKEKDFELSRLLKIKETQIKELEEELTKLKLDSENENDEIEKLNQILEARENELREMFTDQTEKSDVEVMQLEEKLKSQEQIIKDLTIKLENARFEQDHVNWSEIEVQKKRIADAILNANEQADKILFQAQIEVDKVEKETAQRIEQEERIVEKLQKDIENIKSISAKVLSCYSESIDDVLKEIVVTQDWKNHKTWSVING